MLDIVQLPLARRLWKISKLFQLPISHPLIQDMNLYDIDFYELSDIADDPKKLDKLRNTYYDPDFDDWLDDFDKEQAANATPQGKVTDQDYEEWEQDFHREQAAKLQEKQDAVDLPDTETANYTATPQQSVLETEEYEMGATHTNDEWEVDDDG